MALGHRYCMAVGVSALVLVLSGVRSTAQDGNVHINVAVVDAVGQPVMGLQATEFEVASDGKPQQLIQARSISEPVSMFVLLDRSGSVTESSSLIHAASSGLMRHLRPTDRIRFAVFGETTDVSPAFTSLRPEMDAYLRQPAWLGNQSAVWDAVSVGVRAASTTAGALVVVVSDGLDNASRTSPEDIQRVAQAAGMAVYGIGVPTRVGRQKQTSGPTPALKNLSLTTGGGFFVAKTSAEVDRAAAMLAGEVTQGRYTLELSSAIADGKAHRLRIKVRRPQITVRAPRTYLSPAGQKK